MLKKKVCLSREAAGKRVHVSLSATHGAEGGNWVERL